MKPLSDGISRSDMSVKSVSSSISSNFLKKVEIEGEVQAGKVSLSACNAYSNTSSSGFEAAMCISVVPL